MEVQSTKHFNEPITKITIITTDGIKPKKTKRRQPVIFYNLPLIGKKEYEMTMNDDVGGFLQLGRTVILKLMDSMAKNYYVPSADRKDDIRKIIGISNQTFQYKSHWFFRTFIVTHLEEQQRLDDDDDESLATTEPYSVYEGEIDDDLDDDDDDDDDGSDLFINQIIEDGPFHCPLF
jgi:hypothetical protein